jgi:hypothetical protein
MFCEIVNQLVGEAVDQRVGCAGLVVERVSTEVGNAGPAGEHAVQHGTAEQPGARRAQVCGVGRLVSDGERNTVPKRATVVAQWSRSTTSPGGRTGEWPTAAACT